MKIKSEKQGDALVVSFEKPCYLDNETEDYFVETMTEMLKDAKIVLLDFSKIEYVNSSGLGSLIRVYSMAKASRCPLKIFSLTERIETFFKITKMNTLFDIYDSREDALSGVK